MIVAHATNVNPWQKTYMKKHRKPLKLETFLPYRLSVLSNTLSGAIAATYEDKYGMTMPEWRIMCILAEYPGLSADEVCQKTRIEKSVVSRAVARLLNRHLLSRKFDEQDRRRSILSLSVTGMLVYDEVIPIAISHEKKLLKNFSRQERATLNELIGKLQEEAESLKK